MIATRSILSGLLLVLASGPACFPQDKDKEKANLKAENSWTVVVAFSPDGKRLVSGGGPHASSYLWDIQGEKPITKLEAGNLVNSAAFSADGRLLVTVGLELSNSSTRVRIWNGLTGKRVGEIPVDLGTVAAISPDSKVLVTLNLRKMGVQFYRLPDGQQIGELPHPSVHGSQEAVQVSPDGSLIAAGYDKGIWVGDSSTGEDRVTFETVSQLKALVFSQGKVVWSRKHTKAVNGLAMASTGTAVASSSEDNSVRIWNLLTGEAIRVINSSTSGATSVAFSPDSKMLAIGNGGGVSLWEVQVPAPTKGSAATKRAVRKKAKK
jgi:WD40 repeat protein